MRLLLMGDFSHRPASERRPMAERPTLRVDVDNLDACIARLVPRVQLEGVKIVIEQIEDLHPDCLFAMLPRFQSLWQAKSQPASSGSELIGSLLG
jgi:predicted component of type VI protein secretion system